MVVEHPVKNADKMALSINEKLEKSQLSQKREYDKKALIKDIFEEGELVVITNSRQIFGQVRSFQPKFLGPYAVLERLNEVNYRIREISTGKELIVHFNRMTRYRDRNPPQEVEKQIEKQIENHTSRERCFLIDERKERTALIVSTRRRRVSKKDGNLEQDLIDLLQEEIPALGFVDDQEIVEKQPEKNAEEKGKYTCDFPNCKFSTNKETGVAIHYGRSHKEGGRS